MLRTRLMSLIAATAVAFLGGIVTAFAKPNCGMNADKSAAGEPIVIGSINGVTGPDDFSSSAKAAQAYFNCVNASGGINGRPIKYVTADDQWRPDVAAQVATKLVKDDKVVAMIGSNSIIECMVNAPLYERENVMVIGIGVAHECFTSKNIAPINEGPRISGVGMLRYATEKLGVKKVACLVWKLPAAPEWLCDGYAEWGKRHGVTVSKIIIDPSSSDYTSAMLQAVSTKPDGILLNFTKGAIIQSLVAAEQQDLGSKYKFLSLASGYVVGLPESIGEYWNNRFWTELEFTPLDGTGADNKNWQAVMDNYGSRSDPRDTFSQGGYLAAKIATEALLKLDPSKIDRTTVSAALREVKGVKSDLLCNAWYVGNGTRHNANHAGMIAVTNHNDWKPEGGCVEIDDPELDDIVAGER